MSPASIEEVSRWWDRLPCGIRRTAYNRYFVQPHILEFAQFDRWKGKRALEIGCGIGRDTLKFAAAGARIVAIDVSERSADLARERVMEYGNAVVYCMNAEERLPKVSDIGYDLIYSFGVIHHSPHPERILKLAFEHLADAGELRIMLYAKNSIKFLLGQQPEAQAGCPIVHTYTMRSAIKLIEDAGFKVASITKTHIFPYKVRDYIYNRYVKHRIWQIMPAPIFHWLEGKLGHHLLIVARKP